MVLKKKGEDILLFNVPHFCSCMSLLENILAKGSGARKGDLIQAAIDQFSNNFHSAGGRIVKFLNF